jgi:3-phenylpropionate/trans-cinnamate dioxygenase ferredoxin component
MAEYVAVAKAGEIADQSGRCFEVKGRRIAVFNLGGEYFAIDDTCTHADGSLSEGFVSGQEVTCPLHMATFEISTGRCTGPPADADVTSYPVRITEGTIEVKV